MQNTPASAGGTGERLLLVTKLAMPPVRSDLVARPRLVNQLSLGVQRPLTLIAAPAGFGKTTLLSSWLERASLQFAWLSLEQDDDDLTRFWSYVFATVSGVHQGREASALALLQGSPPQQLPPIEAILTVWINGLAALPYEVALILDDYHVITAPSIHRSITYLLDHLPSRLHLVIATRADPPFPLARLRSRGQLTEIRSGDLRFTPLETSSFLTRTLGLPLSGEDIAALEARTEGWIAGLQLAGLSMRGRQDIQAFLQAFTGSQRYIIDYLTEEVLTRQPEPIQTFLLQTSILERLEGSLCEAVLGVMREPGVDASSQVMLEQVEQANLFLVPLDDERRWYRYHQLFAEALRHRLQRKQPTLVPELHRRASGWYEQQSVMYDAVHHALAAGDFALAARLIEQAFNALVRCGEIATLQRWAAALPPELIRSNIELSVLQGWLLFVSGRHDEALRHLEELERTFGIAPLSDVLGEQETPGVEGSAAIRGRIAAIRASIALTQRDLPRTITLSRLALEYLPKENISRAYVAWYLARAEWLSGALGKARIALVEASHVSWEVNHLYVFYRVTHDLAHLQIQQGHLHQANQTYRQALERALERGLQPAMGPAYVGRGNLEREWNHLEDATSLLQEGIKLCEQTGNMQAILQAYIGLAFIHQAQGDAGGASALMRQAVQIQQHHRSLPRDTEVEAVQAWLSLMQGDEAAALGWVQSSGLSVDQELNHVREREYLTLVRVLMRQHRLDEVVQWLTSLLHLAETQGRMGSMIELLMLQAEALQASGEVDQARERLSQALALAEPEGYIRLFVDEGAPMARLLLQVRRRTDRSGSTDYQEKLLALLGREHVRDVTHPSVAIPQSTVQLLREPLSERELEILRLIAAGCSNQEIADRLVIALSTVKWYINAIYGKLQVESRTKAIARARELNIV